MAARWDLIPPNDDYKYPQNMSESLAEVKESMKKRPYYCYRIFVNNVDHYISREIAKFFNGEYLLTPELMNNMKDTKKPIPEEEKKDEKIGKDKKGKKGKGKGKGGGRQSKSGSRQSKTGSRKSKSSSGGRRSSKRQSRASKSPDGKRKSRASKGGGGKRKSKASGGGRRRSQKSGGRRQTNKKGSSHKVKGRSRSSPTIPAAPEVIEETVEALWPKFRTDEARFIKLYDWDEDYRFLEDLRLLTKQQVGFDFQRAREFHGETVEWDEEMRRKMKERAWMYTRCIPPCGGLTSDRDGDAALFFSEFMTDGPPSPPSLPSHGPGGDAPAVGKRAEETLNAKLKPNVETLVKDFREQLWREDRGEKSLNYYNEDLFWGYPTHQVVATRVMPLPEGELPPYYVFETIPNIKTHEDFVKNLFPCMIQIYDITKSPDCIEEAKMALDMLIDELKTYSEEVRLKNQALYGIHTFILLSPLLTWAETTTLAKQPQDILREEYFRKRIPHPSYKKHWEFENYVYEKAYEYRDLLKIIVIGVGCVYGNGDHDLKPYYEFARRNITPVLHLGRGFNIVPLIHVEDLARLILQLIREWPSYTRYIIAAETQFRSSSEIMNIIAKAIAEGYVSNVPFCFGKAFDIIGEDVHNLIFNEFTFNCTYLHQIKKHKFRHDFGADIRNTFIQYEKEQGYRQTRIVLFGPSDADQREIGEALAAHYKVPYINSFRAVKIFLRTLLDLQNRVLDSALPKPTPRTWKLGEGETDFYQFNISAPLEWHRENRMLFCRDPKLEDMREAYIAGIQRSDPTNCRVSDLPRPDFFDMDTLHKAEPADPKYQEAKEHLLHFDKLKQNGADLLGALIRVDIQALIVHELLKFSTCKNNGYVLDGLPTSEEEAEIIFSTDGMSSATPARPKSMVSPGAAPQGPQAQAQPSTRSPSDFQYLPSEKLYLSRLIETGSASGHHAVQERNQKPSQNEIRILDIVHEDPGTSHVFYIKKSEREAFRDLIKGGNAASFQKEFMDHFRRMQTHRLIMNRTRSALDFFEDKFNMITYCFDSGATPSDQIVKNIIELIGDRIDTDPLYQPASEPAVDTTVTLESSYIKKQLGVYSEDDGPRADAAERTEQLVEPWEIEFPRVEKSAPLVQPEVPLSERVFSQEEIEEAKTMGGKMIKEIMELPDRSLAFIHYLNKFASKSVIKAAIKAGEETPQDVIDWTAFQLMANNEGARMPLNKVIPQPPQPNLSEYPFYVDKYDKNYVAHLE